MNTKHIELDNYKKIKILELIWNSEKFNSFNPESLVILIDELFVCFKQQKDYFLTKIEMFDCGNDNYKNYPDILTKLKESGVHKPDYIIVIDANVFSSKKHIIFLTCDEKLYSKINNCDFLNIQGYELIRGLQQ